MTSALNHKWKKTRSKAVDACERCKLRRRRSKRKMRNRRDAADVSKAALAHRRTIVVIEYSTDGETWHEGFVYCRGS